MWDRQLHHGQSLATARHRIVWPAVCSATVEGGAMVLCANKGSQRKLAGVFGLGVRGVCIVAAAQRSDYQA